MNTNKDTVLEDIAAILGVQKEVVSLEDIHILDDGNLRMTVVAPTNAVQPDDFETQVLSTLNGISGLEDETVGICHLVIVRCDKNK